MDSARASALGFGQDGREPLPQLLRPMLATPGTLPAPEQDPLFGYEMKWDGVRAVVYAGAGGVRLRSRNDRDISATYPELLALAAPAAAAGGLVVDGEIVAFDRDTGRVSFAALQRRMHVQAAARVERLRKETPATFLAFDVLHLAGHGTTGLPYRQRRQLLESLQLRGPRWDTPPYFDGPGADVLAASREQGLEGVVAKRLGSAYEPGRRSADWVKVKHETSQDVVVGGWRPGKGRRADGIGSLLLGVPGLRGLEYVGHVGTGFTAEMLDDLYRRLRPLERATPPFVGDLPREVTRDAHWARPALVGEVRYAEWTPDRRLRHPSWRGLRPDLSPDEVVAAPREV